jgi:hypothetical protein
VLGVAANVMRQILVDYAGSHRSGKWGDGLVQVTLIQDLVEGSTAQPLTYSRSLKRSPALPSLILGRRISSRRISLEVTFEDIAHCYSARLHEQ